MKNVLLTIGILLTLSFSLHAQTFSSGSTGADGALDLASSSNCPNGICEVPLPESGILHYTTVNIPPGRTLRFKRNYRNTPVTMLAQGNITIAGTIDVSANNDPTQPGSIVTPGPGGFYGGQPGQSGFGPGGGFNTPDGNREHARWVGSLSLVPIVGGSGGCGFFCTSGCGGINGGGGGGAILIASSSSITVASGGLIQANGAGATSTFVMPGSGGAIRLVANSINASGVLSACGGNCGVIRLEAPAGSLVYNGSSKPLPTLSTTINPTVVPDNNTPSLNIVSIGGYPISYTAGRPDSIDLILPSRIIDPINVVVHAKNVPVGTQVNLSVSGSSSVTFTPGTLSGSQAASSATVAVSGLNRIGASFLLASVEFALPQNVASFNSKGIDQIANVRISAKPGTQPKLAFLRSNGSEVEASKVPSTLRQYFGL